MQFSPRAAAAAAATARIVCDSILFAYFVYSFIRFRFIRADLAPVRPDQDIFTATTTLSYQRGCPLPGVTSPTLVTSSADRHLPTFIPARITWWGASYSCRICLVFFQLSVLSTTPSSFSDSFHILFPIAHTVYTLYSENRPAWFFRAAAAAPSCSMLHNVRRPRCETAFCGVAGLSFCTARSPLRRRLHVLFLRCVIFRIIYTAAFFGGVYC